MRPGRHGPCWAHVYILLKTKTYWICACSGTYTQNKLSLATSVILHACTKWYARLAGSAVSFGRQRRVLLALSLHLVNMANSLPACLLCQKFAKAKERRVIQSTQNAASILLQYMSDLQPSSWTAILHDGAVMCWPCLRSVEKLHGGDQEVRRWYYQTEDGAWWNHT